MTELLVHHSKGCDWYSSITMTPGTCWLAMLRNVSPGTVVVRDSDDPSDLQELLTGCGGWKH